MANATYEPFRILVTSALILVLPTHGGKRHLLPATIANPARLRIERVDIHSCEEAPIHIVAIGAAFL